MRFCSLLVLLISLATPAPGLAQGSRSPSDCTYDTCALRLNGGALLAGLEGREVASYGFFSGPSLRPWIEVSDSAAFYAAVVEENHGRGSVLSFAGGLLYIAGSLLAAGTEDPGWLSVGLVGAGAAAGIVGMRKTGRAHAALHSAIWWYNRSLPGALEDADPEIQVSPSALPRDRRTLGGVVGGVLGLGVGLGISARHSSGEIAPVVVETVAATLIGVFIGQAVGSGSGG